MAYWYIFSLTSALFSALSAVVEKKVLFKTRVTEFVLYLAMINLVISTPFFFMSNFGALSLVGVLVLFIKSCLGGASFFFIMRGIKNLELSNALPLLVLTPGLVAVFEFLLLDTSLSMYAIIGLVFLSVGTYVLNLKENMKIFEPFTVFFTKAGFINITIALTIFTTTSLLDKIILHKYKVPVNELMFLQHVFFALIFLVIFFIQGSKEELAKCNKYWKYIGLLSLFTITYRYTHFLAVKASTSVSLALALKRVSVFMAVIIGGRMFNESSLVRKSIATILMLIGAYFVIVF